MKMNFSRDVSAFAPAGANKACNRPASWLQISACDSRAKCYLNIESKHTIINTVEIR